MPRRRRSAPLRALGWVRLWARTASVRLRLLVLALAPLVLLMPLLLLVGMARWTKDYDALLIANVESDLRIAQQYLSRIIEGTGEDLSALAGSAEFARMLTEQQDNRALWFDQRRAALGLDFLYYLPAEAITPQDMAWPVIASGLRGHARTAIDIFAAEDLSAIAPTLGTRTRLALIETEAALPADRSVEDRGMVVHGAAPVALPGASGVLVGGILLNRNLQVIDTINALVYRHGGLDSGRQGTATLFLEDVRISTNVRLFEDVRALGTRVSAEVRAAVLDEGQTWLNRAFVVNDWYISGYLPLTDSFGDRVGMLYVGYLEAPFRAAKRDGVLWMLAAFAAVLALSAPVFLWLAKGIFSPLERMTQTMNRVRRGNLSARIGRVGRRDEIAQVAAHLDDLLDQVQDRDARLRAWASELNQRVEDRTQELRAANAQLEHTYRQLVMSEKLASIGEITAGVAHEINNPVAVIQGNLDVLRATLGEAAAPVETELTLIDRQTTRIQAIVGKLLQFAASGQTDTPPAPIDMAEVVTGCLDLVAHMLTRGQIAVETDLGPTPLVTIDPGELEQVIVNLVVNAVQAMGDRGTLGLELGTAPRAGQSGALLRVTDTGPGLPEDLRALVFDPFFTTKQAEGTGLGLSISQTLIQRAGGLITAETRAEGGACFTVWLPASAARPTR